MSSALITLTSDITETEIISSATASNLNYYIMSPTKIDVYSIDTDKVIAWSEQYKDRTDIQISEIKLTSRLKYSKNKPDANITAKSTNLNYFTAADLATIYNIPSPNTSTSVCVGVLSFGGGLYGTLQNGVLTNGDVQAYWTSIGIPTNSQPKVIIKTMTGAVNNPNINDSGATIENTLDVQTIGGVCPNPNLTIILYISATNTLSQFNTLLNYMYNTPVTINSINYKPTIISISWGAPEIYYGSALLTSINTILANMASSNINICTATGDNGSNNGVGGLLNYVDFPSSSPYVTAVGGTSLICPNKVYDNSTVETAWSSGGGGISSVFFKPSYQQSISGNYRSIPDIASNADPNTGVGFLVNGETYIYGGTSVAAPTIAGFLAAINNNQLLNSKLYTATSTCYHDITVGSNGGYNARAGYDNCTGYGTIVGNILSSYLNSSAAVLATSLVLNSSTLNLILGQTNQINTIILPNNATNKVLSWTSSDPTVATVINGFVRTIASGTTLITASTTDGSDITANTNVIVTVPIIDVTRVSLDKTSAVLHPTNTLQLSATVIPANATTKNVNWTSSNSILATVNQSGLVTALRNGTVKISVKTLNGNKIATCTLTITVGVASISISPSTANLIMKRSIKLTPTILPTNSANKAVIWTSSNNSIARVRNGTVTGISVGTVTITATTVDMGLTATSTITINPIVRSVVLSSKSIKLTNNDTYQANSLINDSIVNNDLITWESSNTKVATVDNNGLISAISNGIANISIKSKIGNKTDTMKVLVSIPVEKISLSNSTLSLSKKQIATLNAEILPVNASNKLINWSSSDPKIATVNANGIIRALNSGTTTITAKTRDGELIETCIVTVN